MKLTANRVDRVWAKDKDVFMQLHRVLLPHQVLLIKINSRYPLISLFSENNALY